ncbi:uncharacterized protein LOC132029261 [Lycium ferocissimum]|uniref:uncharacterized protein LOC132029261 n=1 Tax=Lycium ferocissimum TaxID=112874 RepID=UPI0028169A45|nr:uncharacterized protein LOC132029261 [Lycium ferocissimum]XP_059274559.1 uncharacterized protein LOC132029261 [Lycium ferocissimum]XP_059274560.1 uncharacterized protein LOC132029261 [Lycium ferocissimum]
MSEGSISSSRTCHCGLAPRQFTSKTPANPGRKFRKCANRDKSCGYWKWDDDDFSDGAVIAINQLRLELEAAKGSINVLNMTLDQVKIERDGLKEKVEAWEAMKNFEANKAMKLEEKVLKLKMGIIMLCALIVGFEFAAMTK